MSPVRCLPKHSRSTHGPFEETGLAREDGRDHGSFQQLSLKGDASREDLAGIGCRGQHGCWTRALGVSSSRPAAGRGGHRPSPRGLAEVSPLDSPALWMVWGGSGLGPQPLARCSLFMWGNVWYVWHLGVYFPGCSHGSLVLECGSSMWAWGGLLWAWLVALAQG